MVGDTADEGAVCLPQEVWDTVTNYTLIAGAEWTKTRGWYYRYSECGFGQLTGNVWIGPFDTEQEAFEDAVQNFGPVDGGDDDDSGGADEVKDWKKFAKVRKLKFT
jgi:hypothetical protein